MKNSISNVPVETVRCNANLSPERVRPMVLVVDDEPLITATLAVILRANGLDALTASNAAEAIEIAAAIPPELLIADFAMPGMNGLMMALEIVEMVPDCKVIMFSGHASASGMFAELSTLGANFEWLTKPLHPTDLLKKVFDVLGKRSSPFGLSRPSQRPDLYDFLLSKGRETDVYQSPRNLTLRECSRQAGDSH